MTCPADRAPAARAAARILGMSWSLRPGMIGATLTPTETPAFASVSITRSRRAGVGT